SVRSMAQRVTTSRGAVMSPGEGQDRGDHPGAALRPADRRVVVMPEKSWEGFFLTSTLARAGVNVVAVVVEHEPTDGVALSLGGWNRARRRVGLRRSTLAFLGLPLGVGYYLRRLVSRSDYPLLRDVRKLGVPIEPVDAFR